MPQRYLVTLNVAVNLGMTRNPAINECPSEISFLERSCEERSALGLCAMIWDTMASGTRTCQTKTAEPRRSGPRLSIHDIELIAEPTHLS